MSIFGVITTEKNKMQEKNSSLCYIEAKLNSLFCLALPFFSLLFSFVQIVNNTEKNCGSRHIKFFQWKLQPLMKFFAPSAENEWRKFTKPSSLPLDHPSRELPCLMNLCDILCPNTFQQFLCVSEIVSAFETPLATPNPGRKKNCYAISRAIFAFLVYIICCKFFLLSAKRYKVNH